MDIKIAFVALLVSAALECQAGKAGSPKQGGLIGFGQNVALINSIRNNLTMSQIQATFAARTANRTVQNQINTAQNQIDARIITSQNTLAASSSQNANCDNAYNAAISQVNSAAVRSCDQSEQLVPQCAALGRIYPQIGSLFVQCPPTAEQAQCIETNGAAITTQINNSLQNILTITANAPAEAAACTGQIVQQSTDALNAADAAYSQCLGSA